MNSKLVLLALVSVCCIFAVHLYIDSSDPIEVERDETDSDYAYDPSEFFQDDTPDVEGKEPPTPKWHACRFQSKTTGQIYDLRSLSRNKKLLERVQGWFANPDLSVADWVHEDATIKNQMYYLNICSDVLLVPPACKKLQKSDPAPAYDVTPSGECFYLGTPIIHPFIFFPNTFRSSTPLPEPPRWQVRLERSNGDPSIPTSLRRAWSSITRMVPFPPCLYSCNDGQFS